MAEFNVPLAKEGLTTKYIGRKIVHKPVTVTTMNDAESGARQGDPNGTVYIADRMTGARGTKGRSWVAESSSNLYMSYVLHIHSQEGIDPYRDRRREFDLDIAGALAALQVLKEVGLAGVKIKWLNDLWIRGHKLLGALTEYKGKISVESKEHHLYILGIGLNINCDMRRNPDMHTLSTSVMCELGHSHAREDIFFKICNHLEPLIELDRRELMRLYTVHEAIKPGDKVMVQKQNASQLYYFEGVKENWSVDLKDEEGELCSVSCTEASLRPYRERVVYIINDPHTEIWSYKLLQKTCCALTDTQKYDVKSIMAEEISLDCLSSCALLVIGQLKAKPINARYVTVVMDYIKRGGSSLCVGNACSLFQFNETFTMQDQEHKEQTPSVVTTTMYKEYSETKFRINLCSFNDIRSELSDICKRTKVLSYRVLENADQKTGNVARNYDCSKFGQNQEDVLVCEYGKGKICFCRPNIEISYADIEEHFLNLSQKMSLLQETTYERDCLFLEILKELGL